MKTKFSHRLLCALSKVHYLSLDIEGGEMAVLRTIPWHNVDIWLLSVEVALLSCEAWALITIWNLFSVDQKNIRKCEHSTIKLQINHFCSFSRQTTALRSAPISGGAGGNRNPQGTIFMFRSPWQNLDKSWWNSWRAKDTDGLEQQVFSSASAPVVVVVRLTLLLSVLCGGATLVFKLSFPYFRLFLHIFLVHAGIDDLFCRPDKVSVPESLV